MSEIWDVVVVGAGPSGSICAYLTAKSGLSTLLLEEHDQPGLFVNCTGIIGTEAFQQLPLPTDSSVGSLQAITFYAPSGRSFRYDPGEVLAFIVDRHRFDQSLAQMAKEAGASVRCGVHVRLIRVEEKWVELRQKEEDPDPFQAKVAVLATGFGSNLPSQVGLNGPKRIVYGAQTEIPMGDLKDVEIYLGRNIAPEAFAWVVPLAHGQARVGLTVPREPTKYFKEFLSHPAIRSRIQEGNPKVRLSPIPTEPMELTVTDRVIVVGEAAGQVKTTTQGGIYYGMLCAALAAQSIEEAAQRNDFRASGLMRYDLAWKQAIGPELKAGNSLRELFSSLNDEQIDAMVELGARDDIIALVKRLAQFDWHRELIWSSLRLSTLKKVAKGGLW